MNAHSASGFTPDPVFFWWCGFDHKVTLVGHKMNLVGHKVPLDSA
jgi:hypothetical protein